jgi:hypothetical protein
MSASPFLPKKFTFGIYNVLVSLVAIVANVVLYFQRPSPNTPIDQGIHRLAFPLNILGAGAFSVCYLIVPLVIATIVAVVVDRTTKGLQKRKAGFVFAVTYTVLLLLTFYGTLDNP